MSKRMFPAVTAAACMVALCGATAANAATTTSVGVSGFYLTGKYGHSKSTDIYYVPLTFRLYSGDFGFSVSLPYLSKTGPTNVLPNIGSVGTGSGTTSTRSGMGDVRLTGTYRVWNDPANGVAVTLGAKVKLGTASYANGLGTGKNDYALQAALSRSSGPLYLALTGGYRKQGSPAGLKLRNVAYGQADIIYRISKANSLGLSTFYTQASLATGTDRLLSTAYFSHRIGRSWSGTAFLMKGYTRSSPDYGGGLSIRYTF